jgi:hypothetical protein
VSPGLSEYDVPVSHLPLPRGLRNRFCWYHNHGGCPKTAANCSYEHEIVPEAQQALPRGLLNRSMSRIPPGHAQSGPSYHDRPAQPVSRDDRLVMPGERGTRRPPRREGSPPPRACDVHYGINPASIQCHDCRKCGRMLDWTMRYGPPTS